MFVGLMFLLTIFARLISEQKRIKCARVLRRIFEVVFTHYRLSRMLLFHILHFIVRMLTTIFIRRMQKYKQNCDSECEEGTSRWSGLNAKKVAAGGLMNSQMIFGIMFYNGCAYQISISAVRYAFHGKLLLIGQLPASLVVLLLNFHGSCSALIPFPSKIIAFYVYMITRNYMRCQLLPII